MLYRHQRYDEPDRLPPQERPTFYDLKKHAEAGFIRRGLARYFIPNNYQRSIKIHRALGTPIIRAVVMGTVGRMTSPGDGGNYRTDHSRSRLEAAINFAFRGSVFNEVVRFITNAIGSSFNLGLVALQRYNRARMIQRADEELMQGSQFREDYKN